jgi:hypothetical protein
MIHQPRPLGKAAAKPQVTGLSRDPAANGETVRPRAGTHDFDGRDAGSGPPTTARPGKMRAKSVRGIPAPSRLSAAMGLSPRMQHINNVCAEYEVALGAIAAYTSTVDKPAV